MWIAKQEMNGLTAKFRRNGRFVGDCDSNTAAEYLFDWGWSEIKFALARMCRNQAAVACLDGRDDHARRWLDRAKALEGIE